GPIGAASVDAEVRTALALELVHAANASLLAASGGTEADADVAARLGEALVEVRASLKADPADTRAWIGGYPLLQSARLLGPPDVRDVGEARAPPYLDGPARTTPRGGELRPALASIMVSAGRRDEALAQYRLAFRDPTVDALGAAEEMLDAGYAPADVLAA